MRVGFDARYLSHGLTGGVRTYVYHLVTELIRCGSDHEWYIYADDKAPFEIPELPSNATLRLLPWRGGISSVRNDRSIGGWMERDGVDVVHGPANYGPTVRVPLVVTVHDALNLFPMSEHLRGFGRRPRQVAMMAYLGLKTRASLRRASAIITVSRDARDAIADRAGLSPQRFDVIYEAAAPQFRPQDDAARLAECRKRWRLERPFILADGIKNPEATINAYRRLSQEMQAATDVVFFSREAEPRPAVAAASSDPHIKFLSRPSDADLVALMNLATLFAFPSWYEGFGLPIVEAMQCGLPVVASSRGAIPEILGDGGLLFDVDAHDVFAAQLSDILSSQSYRADLSRKALARARQFSWADAAQRTIAVYERVVHGGVEQTA